MNHEGTRLRLGLSRGWAAGHAAVVSAHNRTLWDQKVADMGCAGSCEVPGFSECLGEMYAGGYSLTDIAVTFGLSRERIRQIVLRDLGMTGRGALVRYWDDDLGCFRAYPADELPELLRRANVEHKKRTYDARSLILAERQAHLVEQLMILAAGMDRQPTLWEVAKLVYPNVTEGASGANLAGYWDARRNRTSYVEVYDEIFATAGIERERMTGKTERYFGGWGGKRKLTMDQAREIRALRAAGATGKSLANKFGVSAGAAWKIISGETYKEDV